MGLPKVHFSYKEWQRRCTTITELEHGRCEKDVGEIGGYEDWERLVYNIIVAA